MATKVPFTPEGIRLFVESLTPKYFSERSRAEVEFSGDIVLYVNSGSEPRCYNDAYVYYFGDNDWKLESELTVSLNKSILESCPGANANPYSAGFRNDNYFIVKDNTGRVIEFIRNDKDFQLARQQIREHLTTLWKLNELNKMAYSDSAFKERLFEQLKSSGNLHSYARFIKEYSFGSFSSLSSSYVQKIASNLGGEVEDFYLLKKKG